MNTPWTLAPGQHAQSFETEIRKTVRSRFLLYLPDGYDAEASKKWPLIVFLHGSGERGDDLEQVKAHGLPQRLDGRGALPFIVVSPQAPADTRWDSDTIHALLDELIDRLAVDAQRISLTGVSLGGYGTWAIAGDRPQRFAAIAPVCGAGETDNACRLKDVPIWAFHGAQDSVVPLQDDQAMVDAVRACGGDVKFTVYPGVDHDAWTPTYANPALYEWFLQHRRAPDKPE